MADQRSLGFRIGVDVGGTFTDIACWDDVTGSKSTAKLLTSSPDPSEAVLAGIAQLLEADVVPSRVTSVVHGTTLITNALIERRGAITGLLATRGFRDVLYFGEEYRYDVFDPHLTFPEPLVPRPMRLEVDERIDGRGRVLVPLDQESVVVATHQLLEAGADSIAVCYLHAYRNPAHELATSELIAGIRPDLPVSLSHEVFPQIREFVRTSVTVVNAYSRPIMEGYLSRLTSGLARLGIECGLHLMTSAGGSITTETAAKLPVQLIESGPAAGSVAAGMISAHVGEDLSLSFDMGGTTAKACVIRRAKPSVTTGFEVARIRRFKKGSGIPIGLPVIDMIEIGAGGGSIADIDDLGLIRVGPRSAGSDPGPACYGRGGRWATVTDANVLLGFLDPGYFLGGKMKLEAALAQEAIASAVARRLGISPVEAADAICRVVTENMAEAARVHAVEMNADLRDRTLIAFGGAGPLHAVGIAERLGMSSIVCPPDAGILSALGLLAAPLSFEFARSYSEDLLYIETEAANEIVEELEQKGRALLGRAGVTDVTFDRSVDMCYSGQGYEVTTPIARPRFEADWKGDLRRAFDQAYAAAYGRHLEGYGMRCITWRVRASAPEPTVPFGAGPDRRPEAAAVSDRSPAKEPRLAYFSGFGFVETPVFERRFLTDETLSGPALIEDHASTIVVPPGYRSQIDKHSNVVIRSEGGDSRAGEAGA